MTDDFVTEAQAKLGESNWLKPMTFFQRHILKLNPWTKMGILLFFSSLESPLHYAGSLVLFFSKPFFSSVSLALSLPILFPLHHCHGNGPVCGLCPQALSWRLLASENKLAGRKANKWSGSVHFCQGGALPIGNPITKQTWLSSKEFWAESTTRFCYSPRDGLYYCWFSPVIWKGVYIPLSNAQQIDLKGLQGTTV